MSAAVYRFYDAQGDVIYIGHSSQVFSRLATHDISTPWIGEVAAISVEWHSDKVAAYHAEQDAIIAEQPRYNLMEPSIPPSHHRAIIQRLTQDPFLTYTAVGKEYGVSRERIRQIVPPDLAAQRKAERERQRLGEKLAARMRRAIDRNLVCKACGAWILRQSPTTCSPPCAKAWTILRSVDNHDEHRVNMAKTYLAQPDKYPASFVDWAERMLSDAPPPPNRRFLHHGSKRAEVIKKYRPELYADLVSA